jgi:hypothetical protein
MDAMKISAVMANSWPYLTSVDSQADEEFFGLSKSAFTLGAIVASLLSGWLSNRISHTKWAGSHISDHLSLISRSAPPIQAPNPGRSTPLQSVLPFLRKSGADSPESALRLSDQ